MGSSRERRLWSEFVCQREERKNEKPVRKRRSTKPRPTPAELEAALDDLTREASQSDERR